jgi:hypothetical protein
MSLLFTFFSSQVQSFLAYSFRHLFLITLNFPGLEGTRCKRKWSIHCHSFKWQNLFEYTWPELDSNSWLQRTWRARQLFKSLYCGGRT